jgi:hypothetical protein
MIIRYPMQAVNAGAFRSDPSSNPPTFASH